MKCDTQTKQTSTITPKTPTLILTSHRTALHADKQNKIQKQRDQMNNEKKNNFFKSCTTILRVGGFSAMQNAHRGQKKENKV